ncbi:hypothetical protein PVAP13_8NG026302 [Panicum virgatum]|uniref:Uncharacterized protein n=1 Tax=Panicum virgatum TaxID=38727 RepID=A0A8T0P257_PANVG|nr:hypothetical protein PVAP13_8NG026302 [Panicum virgatum]
MARDGGPVATAGLGRGSTQASTAEDCGGGPAATTTAAAARHSSACGQHGAGPASSVHGDSGACRCRKRQCARLRARYKPFLARARQRAYRPVAVVASEDLQRWQWWRPGTVARAASRLRAQPLARMTAVAWGGARGGRVQRVPSLWCARRRHGTGPSSYMRRA